jgi:hypothetical protein
MIKFVFIPHFAIRIVCAFIFFTVIGTITHEFGHIAVAKYFGYETELHYGSMRYDYPGINSDSLVIELRKNTSDNAAALKNKENFEGLSRRKELFKILKEKYPYPENHGAWITLGGPAQTLLTSFLGLFILFYRRSKMKEHFVLMDWIGVFLSLFALREIFNYFTVLFRTILHGDVASRNDEFKLSRYLDLNQWTIPTVALVVGTVICTYVIFRVIPLQYRFTFLVAGFAGGILGYFIWLRWMGPVILP